MIVNTGQDPMPMLPFNYVLIIYIRTYTHTEGAEKYTFKKGKNILQL